jgi:signal transduction histidine kinase/CheY-like chemotaxis protein
MVGKDAIDPAWSFVHENGRRMTFEHYPVNRVLASGKPVNDYVVGIKRPDRANITWALVNAFPETDANGALTQVVVTFVDITTLKRLESQLVQAQKMEAVGQLTGGIAHDFNNILHAINGYAQLAEDDTDRRHPARKSLTEIRRAAERAAAMVNQLLAFSRRQLMEPSCVSMNDVISNLVTMLERVIGEHIKLHFIPGHQLSSVMADHTMIEQVLLNLCVNSRDAMPGGGILTIETENVLFDQDYCAQNVWAKPGRYVLISVTDTGAGIAPDVLEHIFDPFFTTKPEGTGTGLGLATVYGAVRQHDGMVRVYSELDKGTTFKVYLPAVQRRADIVGTKITGEPPGGTETILVAEDEDSLRDLAKQMLERAGYTVVAAANGKEAIRQFNEHAGEIDLLLLDVVMPEMGGRDVFDHIRERDPDVAVLFASGYSENAIHTNFVLKAGMELIRKPYRLHDLLERVRIILDDRATTPSR